MAKPTSFAINGGSHAPAVWQHTAARALALAFRIEQYFQKKNPTQQRGIFLLAYPTKKDAMPKMAENPVFSRIFDIYPQAF